MVKVYSDDTTEILRLNKNEELVKTLSEYYKRENLRSATFQVIGAISSVLLSFYNIKTKEYEMKQFNEDLEITSVIGNITFIEPNIKIHAHGTFSKKDFTLIGGHIQELTVSATGEIHLTKLNKKLKRKYDEETGLYLLQATEE